MILLLGWHYVGCFWWWVGNDRSVIERMSVLGSQFWFSQTNGLWTGLWAMQEEEIPFGMRYLAAFYWAILMTTGLNVPLGPGLRESQIIFECVISFFGVCMQAYMLGATASEIANMDAKDSEKRQKFEGIKQVRAHPSVWVWSGVWSGVWRASRGLTLLSV